MTSCINKLDPQYQYLQQISDEGVKPFIDYYVLKFLNEKGRYPKVDEIPGMSTVEALIKNAKLREFDEGIKCTETENILNYTGAETIEKANPILNNKLHPDLEVGLTQIGNTVFTSIHKRPSQFNPDIEKIEVETNNFPIKNSIIINQMLDELSRLYGIKFIPITTKELLSLEWDKIISDAGQVNAFVYNNNIYINTDNARLDAPLHEMSHIILGALRFLDPTLYSHLISQVTTLPNYQFYASQFTGRTENDINEEIFVTQMGKYLAGLESEFESIPSEQLDMMLYHMKRVLDSMIFGQYSVKNLPTASLLKQSLLSLGKKTSSSRFNLSYPSSLELSELHRSLNNTKSDLMKSNDLIQECN